MTGALSEGVVPRSVEVVLNTVEKKADHAPHTEEDAGSTSRWYTVAHYDSVMHSEH